MRLWGRSLLCALFALGFLLACLPGNGGFLAAAQAQAVSPEQATTILDQSSPAPSRRSKSAIAAPPVGPSPIDQAATLAPNRTPDLAPALIRANDQSWAPGPKRAVALPTQTAPPAPKPRPKDGEYLPDDFFAELQGDSAPDAWAWDGELARKGARVTSPRDPSRPEIRGVWLTTSDMAVWRDRASLRQAIRELAALNFNTIYPVVWTRGYVTYPSPTAAAAGIPQRSQGIQGQDLLTELIAQAHREQISVIPWFEYGFMVPPESELALAHGDWLSEQRQGEQTEQRHHRTMAWLNPFKPEVQALMGGLVVDLVRRYDVDGIQFDDHFSLPRTFGYDAQTRSRYQNETGRPLPSQASDAQWSQWRADQLTTALSRIHRAVKAVNPELIVSIAPNQYDFAHRHYLQDWRTWMRRGLVDELIVQAYRMDHEDFLADLRRPEVREAQQHIPTGIGILAGLRDRRISIDQIQRQARAAQAEGLGVSFFFYQSLWENASESIAQRKSGFRSIFPQAVPRLARL